MPSDSQTKAIVFILSFACMASRHSCLSAWYMLKPTISTELNYSSTELGAIDTIYLFGYSFGLYVSGVLGDGYSMKIVISSGMILASISYYLMVLFSITNLSSWLMLMILWGLQGLLQSTVWPGTVSLIGNWFPKSSHGGWMGLWSSNASVGNIIGFQSAILLFTYTASWEFVMLSVTTFMLITAVLSLIFIQDRPTHLSPTMRKGRIGFWQACRLPGVIEYSCAYGCIKMLIYAMMMWLPFYLVNHVKVSKTEKGLLLALFEVAGMISSFVAGAISDKIHSRVKVVIIMMLLSLPVLYLFRFGNEDNVWVYYFLIPVSGMSIVACSNLVTTCVATDLAHYTERHKHTHAMATVTGIIDGTGSLGAACGQVFIGWLAEYSWDFVFYFMICVGMTSVVILFWPLIEGGKENPEMNKELLENE